MNIKELKELIKDLPDTMRVLTTDEKAQAWTILRSDVGELSEIGEQVFIISRFVKGYGQGVIKG